MLATRESRARALAAATAATVMLLSALFAMLHNPAHEPAEPAPPLSTSGRAVFERMSCLNCHALAERGVGVPLDGVGARLTRAQLRDWALGGDIAAKQLPAAIVQIKQRYATDPEIEALLDYLQQLQ